MNEHDNLIVGVVNDESKTKQFNFELRNLKYEIEHLTKEVKRTDS